MKNYIVINGKRAELTEAQLKALGISIPQSPFGTLAEDQYAFFINEFGGVGAVDAKGNTAVRLNKVANVFNDSNYAYDVTLHQTLYRQLLKFRCAIEDEGDKRPLYFISYDSILGDCGIVPADEAIHFGEVYFSEAENAIKAAKEIVRPFLKAHPNFKWIM